MGISNQDNLQTVEKLIGRRLQRIRLDDVFLGLRRSGNLPSIGSYPPISVAICACFIGMLTRGCAVKAQRCASPA